MHTVWCNFPSHVVHSRLEGLEETLVAGSVKVIVIDSVASLMRKEFDASSVGGAGERVVLMSRITCILK